MRVAYIPAKIPWGSRETFILGELVELRNQGIDLLICPRNPPRQIIHALANELIPLSCRTPVLSLPMLGSYLASFVCNKKVRRVSLDALSLNYPIRTNAKNAVILAKALYLAKLFLEKGITHIHAHWGTTTSTIAMVASSITGIPWSFTVHRGDIDANNLLKEKIRSASFCRAISVLGRKKVCTIIGPDNHKKIRVIHMGVEVPPYKPNELIPSVFTVICPGRLEPVKGHKYLIEAIKLLSEQNGVHLRLDIIGDGSLRGVLDMQVHRLGLDDIVHFKGFVPHDELLARYGSGKVSAVILPSIETETGDHEGIPVALMEPMANGIPVIGTTAGGTPELLEGGAGLLVPPKDPKALANAIISLLHDNQLYRQTARRGWERVNEEFNIRSVAQKLIELFN